MSDDVVPASPTQRVVKAVGRGSRLVADRLDAMFSVGGPGFRKLAVSHATAVAADTLVTMALAGTLFFQVPSSEARGNVALYLLLTLAPFAVLGPLLTTLFARFPTSYRAGLVVSAAGRLGVAFGMVVVGLDSFWLFPLAFALLVLSRIHGISRGSLLPVALDEAVALVSANARLARLGIIGSALAVAPGALLVSLASWPALIVAMVLYGYSALAGLAVPNVDAQLRRATASELAAVRIAPRAIRMARLATAGVRFLNGFLLLLVAFAFRDQDARVLDFGALLAAAGAGFFVASLISPFLERRLREEPMVVAALAIEAAAAFIAAQVFGLPAATVLSAAAGLAWGTAKFGFDGLLQTTVSERARGHAFTVSETVFQLTWVLGALVPVLIDMPAGVGLAGAGVAALAIQVVYISGLLVPLTEARRNSRRAGMAAPGNGPEAPAAGGPEPEAPPERSLSDLL